MTFRVLYIKTSLFRRWMILLALLFVPPVLAFQIDIGKISDMFSKGKEAATEINEEQEIVMGRELASGLLGAAPLVASDELQLYVNRIGYWLALQSERPNLPWHFGVLDTDSINAFAAPGGYVFITRGLFMILRDEAELAGVLAHEITHVLRKHHLNAIKKNARTGLLADLISLKASHEGHNIEGLLDVGMDLYARGLDKDDEYESDIMGAVISARAGYRASGLNNVLLSLDAIEPDDSAIALMFKTHPKPHSRIKELDQYREGLSAYWNKPPGTTNDQLARYQDLIYTRYYSSTE